MFLDRVATVNVLKASNTGVKLCETRTVHFLFERINKLDCDFSYRQILSLAIFNLSRYLFRKLSLLQLREYTPLSFNCLRASVPLKIPTREGDQDHIIIYYSGVIILCPFGSYLRGRQVPIFSSTK